MTGFLRRLATVIAAQPDTVALTDQAGSLTYGELDRHASAYRDALAAESVGAGDVVALEAIRGIEAIAALIGIWRANAACLPFQTSLPAPRLAAMFNQCAPRAWIGRTVTEQVPMPSAASRIPLLGAGLARRPSVSARRLADADEGSASGAEDELAYVLFTSGSTGVPKGVAMPHRALEGLINWQIAEARDPAVTTLQFAPLFFDVAFQEIMATLGAGGTLVVASEEDRNDVERLCALIDARRIGRVFLPTAALSSFCRTGDGHALDSLSDVYVAGEQLRITPAVRTFFLTHPHIRLHNQYGPCETHVVTSYVLPGSADSWPVLPPLGRPLPHVAFSLVPPDRSDSDWADDEPDASELVIHGAPVADGYYRDETRSRERFGLDAAGRRTYRTGDLVTNGPDGFVFHGRADQQVKIRGYRIEVAEVESAIGALDDISECAVHPVTVADSVALVAYVVPVRPSLAPGRDFARRSQARWAAFTAQRLPDYMVPTVWVELRAMPLTPTGKVDRMALPAPPTDRPILGTPYRAPATATQQQLTRIWETVLGVAPVGIDDPFFELGGTSLLAASVLAAVRGEFGLPVAAREAYRYPTVRTFAAYLEGSPAHAGLPGRRGAAETTTAERIAVVGMACRLPGAETPDAFWENLVSGRDCITRNASAPMDSESGARIVQAAGLLTDIEQFDSEFFGLRDSDAAVIDPQHRLFLEGCVEALDDAGVVDRGRSIGVFAGCGPSTYLLNNVLPARPERPARNLIDSVDELELLMGSDKDFIASRAAYLLDCTGPVLNVNAACATSLVAVHLARVALLRGECDIALAGAAAVSVPQLERYEYEPAMMYSADGVCRPFDNDASGTVFGNGVGVVALKLESAARRDGDRIYAVIAGSAVGNDGAMKAGMTAPSVAGQAAVIAAAWDDAGIDRSDVAFIEGHGTATPVGDDVEVAALTDVFSCNPQRSVMLGSVKANIGHLSWAAGMAGFIKATLAVHHRQLPGTLHFNEPGGRLNEPGCPFTVSTNTEQWPVGKPLVAGVSAFGLGGVNAHVVISAADAAVLTPPEIDPDSPAAGTLPEASSEEYELHRSWGEVPAIVPVSARSANALGALVAKVADLTLHSNATPQAIAAAAQRRPSFEWRTAVTGSSLEELRSRLNGAPVPSGPVRPMLVTGLFTGQGGEYVGMGQRLQIAQPVFRDALDRFGELFAEHTGHRLSQVLDVNGTTRHGDPIRSIALLQPAVFCVQLALVELWKSWGVTFDAVMGHSLGEFAAAATAGVFDASDGLRLVAARGRLLESLSDDAGMVAVYADPDSTSAVITSSGLPLELSAYNAPTITGVSGTRTALSEFERWAAEADLLVKQLTVNRAGHSWLMDSILDAFEEVAADLAFRMPHVPLISNVTGTAVGAEVTTARYWRDHLRQPVQFASGIATAEALGTTAFVELGGHRVLGPLVALNLPDFAGPVLPTLLKGQRDDRVFAEAVAELYSAGVDVEWPTDALAATGVKWPRYPFDRHRVWIDSPAAGTRSAHASAYAGPDPKESWWFGVSWHDTTVPASATIRSWRVVTDGSPLSVGMVDDLVAAGHSVDATDGFAGDLGSLEHVDEVVLFATARYEDAPDPIGALQAAVEAVLTAVRTVSETASPTRLTVITSNAIASEWDSGAGNWPAAAIVGLVRVARNELGPGRCRVIDVDAGTDPRRLAAGLTAITATEAALRHNRWQIPRLEPVAAPEPVIGLRADRSYLVVGGLRGLGLWSARQLAQLGARHLVLAGRHPPEPPECAVIDALRAEGVTVAVHVADVTDGAQVRGLVEAVTRNPIGGVLYCAGVVDDGVLTEQTWARIEPVLRAKPGGVVALVDELAATGSLAQIEFVTLYSSAASVLGHAGQGSHVAANAMLDSLATSLRHRGVRASAVNWGPWADVGALADRPDIRAQLSREGMGEIGPEDGRDAFARVLRGSGPQIAVLPNDWPSYLDTHDLADDSFYSQVATSGPQRRSDSHPAGAARRAIAVAEYAERQVLVREVVDAAVTKVLGRSGPESFLAMGLDSLSAIRVRNAIAAALECSLPVGAPFEHPSTQALTDFIVSDVLDESWRTIHRPAVADASAQSDPRGDMRERSRPAVPAAQTIEVNTSIQERRWLMLIEQCQYGHRIVPIIFGVPLVESAFTTALHHVVERHHSLRYRYTPAGAMIEPTVDCVPHPNELFTDVSQLDDVSRAGTLAALIDELRANVPSPRSGPSWSVRCVRTASDEFVALLSIQHLDFDGTSLTVFSEELRDAYTAFAAGQVPQLGAVTQYAEYVEWQRAQLSAHRHRVEEFFTGLFAGIRTTTALAGHRGFAQTRAEPSRRYTPQLPVSARELAAAARQLEVSPFAVVLGSYASTIADVINSTAVVISSITSDRGEERFARTIGPLTGPVPLPLHPMVGNADDTARHAHRVATAVNARAVLVPPCEVRDALRTADPLPFDTYFSDVAINFTNYQPIAATDVPVRVVEILGPVTDGMFAGVDFGHLTRVPGLHLVFETSAERCHPNFWYHTERFPADWVEMVAGGFVTRLTRHVKELLR